MVPWTLMEAPLYLLYFLLLIDNLRGENLDSMSFDEKYKYLSRSKSSAGSLSRACKFMRRPQRGSWDWRSKFDMPKSYGGLSEHIAGEFLHRNGAVKEVKYLRRNQTGTVIFLHGSGGNGFDQREYLALFRENQDITFGARHLRFLFPSAPVMDYTAIYGQKSRVWHDRQGIHINLPEMKQSVEAQAKVLKVFIENLVKAGTPLNRIIIGGFSMGGGMALHMAYRHFPQVAGCFALSSFLHNDSMVYEDLAKCPPNTPLPPLLAFHGDKDYMVPYDWSLQMINRLRSLGVGVEFHGIKNETHVLCHEEVDRLYTWFNELLPRPRVTLPSE